MINHNVQSLDHQQCDIFMHILHQNTASSIKDVSVADPGFPVGGGAWTPEAAMFRKICMSKRKNWVP